MPEVRVYQLAKELKVQSALILELLDRMGREVKSDLSSLDGETAEMVRERLIVAIDQEKKRQAAERQVEQARRVEENKHTVSESKPAAAAATEAPASASEVSEPGPVPVAAAPAAETALPVAASQPPEPQ